ncbi:MAG: hypothetical protein EHM64_14490 [Ignavibacteriae bacterium]|nr:MAG: hypothetical protein EHM64_14490 [Ignavibacteriota bacterium]
MKGDLAMMTKMRENMPLIMWILVGAFLATIVFSWGMGGFKTKGELDGVVGRIGEREILYDQYNRLVQDRIAQERGADDKPAPITDEKIRQVRKEVWDNLVRSELMNSYQEKWGIITSDEEVAFAVRNNPPKWIRENENFIKDGQFDRARYEEFLRDPRSAEILVSIESEYRSSIGNQKVIDRIIGPVFVSPDEIWDEYAATTRKFQAVAVTFPLRNYPVDSMSITKAEIEEYYTKNRASYERKEKRKLAYIAIPVTTTREDSNKTFELAQETIAQIKGGEDFAVLATEMSEDPGSAERGGDLGYVVSGRMVKEFDSTMFATEPGQVAGPVATRFGVHIIKVMDRKRGGETGDSVRASHILLKWKPSTDTDERAGQTAKDFTDAAKAEGFTKAAARFRLEVKETDWFVKAPTGNIPGIGALIPAMDFAFASKTGSTSHVFRTKIRNEDNYVVLQVKEVVAGGVTPLAEVENTIRRTLVSRKQETLALEAARVFRGKVRDMQSFVSETERENLKVDTTGEHTQRDFMRVFGSDETIGKMMFTLEPGQVSEPLSNSRGAFVAVLVSKTTADPAEFEKKKAEIEERLRRQKQNNVYTDWLAQAEKAVGVQDNRYLYYPDY